MILSNEPTHGEFAVIAELRDRLPAAPQGELWIGDDAAVIAGGWVVSTDALVLGLDWDPRFSTEEDVGWKAVMVNASDLAAMGARTERLLVTVVAPSAFPVARLYDGIAAATMELGAFVVGGDMSSVPAGSELTVVSVTALGRCPSGRAVRRDGARPGDSVWVSGPLGAAAAGLRMLHAGEGPDGPRAVAHRRPQARVDAGMAAAVAGVTAMIDVSDGLAADAWHLARESEVAVALDEVPVAEGATEDEALAGGDDYELLCTAPPQVDLPGWIRIGECTADAPSVSVAGQPVEPRGYRHWRQG